MKMLTDNSRWEGQSGGSQAWTGVNGRKGGKMAMRNIVERIRYNFPLFTYEYKTSVTPHHIQPQEWEVMLHICI